MKTIGEGKLMCDRNKQIKNRWAKIKKLEISI